MSRTVSEQFDADCQFQEQVIDTLLRNVRAVATPVNLVSYSAADYQAEAILLHAQTTLLLAQQVARVADILDSRLRLP